MTSLRWETHGDEWKKARRERIATAALESLIAGYYSASDQQVHNAASLAVRYADALIAELDKGGEQ